MQEDLVPLTEREIERIADISAALSEQDWGKLKALSERPIPNFDVFLQYMDSFGEKILPLLPGFERYISHVKLPNRDVVLSVPMRTDDSEVSDIMLVLTKFTAVAPPLIGIDYIFRS